MNNQRFPKIHISVWLTKKKNTCMHGTALSRYINIYTDFGYKKIFETEANKNLMVRFLNTTNRTDKIVTTYYTCDPQGIVLAMKIVQTVG